ncbi:hypothetical protein PBOI14_30860 [Pseudomonas sp. Boi14]|nr:hypothetical protein PBOI14_30860 [Pseudomonas sp. Boi14]
MDPLSKLLIGLRWLLFKDGLGASNHFEAGGFIRSEQGLGWPDIQFHFLPAAMRYDGNKPIKGHGFMVLTGPNKPKSRGHVRARSGDPYEHPEILFNYLQREEDREGFRRCVRLTREIIGQPAMDRYRDGEIAPGRRSTRMHRSTSSCGRTWRAPITPAAPVAWARTRWPWWIPNCVSTVLKACE